MELLIELLGEMDELIDEDGEIDELGETEELGDIEELIDDDGDTELLTLELGEIDEAAKAENQKRREFEYQVFSNNCLVELDEEPPHPINQEALEAALQIAHQLNAVIVPQLNVMRKLVIDGSNTSGFQRTAIIGYGGHVETSKGTVRIETIAIEEESAGIVENTEGKATYRLDRLGVPLIEITTDPSIKDAQHLEEVAKKIGLILRATGKVARGIGTIRQDLNVSTEGSNRVEIKGAQDLKMLGEIASGEEKRQLELIKIIFELRQKKAYPVEAQIHDLSEIFKNTSASMIKKGIESGSGVFGIRMKNHRGFLGLEIQKGKRYGTELSDYAKLAGVKGIIHSDEDLPKYSISQEEIEKIKKELKIDEDDAFVMVVAPQERAKSAIKNVLARANMDFVPGETRRANPDGTTTFMRPIPGKARMYPETDIPHTKITRELIEKSSKGESLDQKKEKLEKMLNKDMATNMLKSRNLHLFERIVEETQVEPVLVATTLENTVVALKREGFEFSDLEKTVMELFREYKKDLFVKAAIPEVLKYMAKGARVDAVLKVYRLQKITGAELEKLVSENGCNMPTIMQKYRLQVDPSEVNEIVKKQKCENPAYR
jgi:glutamyl-tRNA(Gln) amidotransferase subunit E